MVDGSMDSLGHPDKNVEQLFSQLSLAVSVGLWKKMSVPGGKKSPC